MLSHIRRTHLAVLAIMLIILPMHAFAGDLNACQYFMGSYLHRSRFVYDDPWSLFVLRRPRPLLKMFYRYLCSVLPLPAWPPLFGLPLVTASPSAMADQ